MPFDGVREQAGRVVVMDRGRIVADGSAAQLSRRVEGRTEVRWSRQGEHFVHAAEDATRFVRELFAQYGDEVADLEVRRATLEDSYMALVQRFEAGERDFVGEGLAVVR